MTTDVMLNIGVGAVVLIFVLFGMFWGVVRGLRRTLIRSAWLIVTAVILLTFLSGVVTNAIIDIIMNSEMIITVNGQEYIGVYDALQAFVESSSVDLEAVGNSIESIIKIITSYMALILNSIVFVLLFWILKIILLPINWLLSKFVFLSKAERKYKKDLKAYKKQIKAYKRQNKGKPRVEAMAFAVGDNEEILAEDLKEFKNETNEAKPKRNALLQAREKYDDSIIEKNRLSKNVKRVEGQQLDNNNELLDKPYVEQKEEVVEEKFIPKEEYKPEEIIVEEKIEKPIKPKKPKKHRFAGMLVGGLLGLFICTITLTPALGILNLARDINNNNESKIELEDGTKQGILDYLTNGMFGEINKYYETSIGGLALKFTGQEWIATNAFKSLTNGKIDGKDANLTKDIVSIIAMVNEANKLSQNMEKIESENYSNAILSSILSNVETLVDNLFNISIVDILTPSVVAIVSDMLAEQATTIQVQMLSDGQTSNGENTLANDIILQISTALRKVEKTEELKMELKSIINILKTLNSGVIINVNGQDVETSMLSEIIKQSITGDDTNMILALQKKNYDYYASYGKYYFTKLITDFYVYEYEEGKAYSPVIANSILPTAVELVLDILLQQLSVERVENIDQDNIDETVKTFLTTVLDELFGIIRQLNTEKDENETKFVSFNSDDLMGQITAKINSNILTSIGKIMDSVVDIVGENTSADVVKGLGKTLADTLKTSLVDMLGEADADRIATNISKAVGNMKAGDFEEEFTKFGEVYNVITGDNPLFDDYMNINNWEALPKVLIELQKTKLFGYKDDSSKYNNMVDVFNSYLSKMKTSMIENLDEDSLDEKLFIKEERIVDFNHVMYNMLNNLQINLTNIDNLDSNGAFDFQSTFYKKVKNLDGVETIQLRNYFFNFIDDLFKADSSELVDFSNTGSDGSDFFDIVIDNSHSDNNLSSCYSCIDEIAETDLFKGVFSKMINDIGIIAEDLFDIDNDSSVNFKSVVSEIFDRFSTTVESNSKKTDDTYYNFINTLNIAISDLYKDLGIENGEGFSFDVSVQSLAAVGEFCDKLTNVSGNSTSLLQNATITSLITSFMDEELIISRWVSEEAIAKPMNRLVEVVRKSIDEGSFSLIDSMYVNVINESRWKSVCSILGKIYENFKNIGSNVSEDYTIILSNLGEVLDMLVGRGVEIKLVENNEEVTKKYGVQFIKDTDAKNFLVGLISNKFSSSKDSINQIVYGNANMISGYLEATGVNGYLISGKAANFHSYNEYADGVKIGLDGILLNIYKLPKKR